MKITIIGGGIIGLSSAWFLNNAGHEVTVIDKTDMQNNCSYGNAGYVCPSHFVPLATPGIVTQGLKWMWNPKSPFYVQPRLDISLIKSFDDDFDTHNWQNRSQAKQLINQAKQIISTNPTKQKLRPIILDLYKLLPNEVPPASIGNDDEILRR